ncbi:MAG: TRAP transporter small permease [Candidatus Competibacteraceae bacterium]|nr:TRAP transporter small permease [Candidatus Competibacteraceae bacterium]
MKLTTAYLKINSVFEKVEKVIAVLLILSIVVVVFAGTVSRYIWNIPIFGIDRLGTYLMVWLGFVGFQIATSKIRHIEVEFVKARVKPATKYLLNIISSFTAAIVIFIFGILSYRYTKISFEFKDIDTVLNLPMWVVIAIIPVSFFISSIRFLFIALLWNDIRMGKRVEADIIKKQLL